VARLRETATAESLGLPRLDGIVGMGLGRTDLTIDYRRRRLAIGTASTVRQTVPLSGDPVFPVVNVDIAGVPAELIVDTGASHLALFLSAVGWSRQRQHGVEPASTQAWRGQQT